MLGALFLTPLILMVPAAATGPALVIVGVLMMQSVSEIDLSDFREALPAVLTLLSIPLMFSIAEGIGLGLIAAAVLALGTGAPRRLNAVGYVLAAIFLAQFLHLGPVR
jgi:AGZA family xanthine/uracil permease-like MFS transporter